MQKFKDPLWLFLGVGVVIFVVAEWSAEPEISYDVVVRETDIARLSDQWSLQMRRPPTQGELDGLVDQFVKEEIYYREAQRLGLDANDTIVRRRMVQKLTFLTEDIATAVPKDEETLRAYYNDNLEDYRIPQRVSFQHRYYSVDRRQNAEADASAFVNTPENKESTTVDDAFMLQKSYALRSQRELGDLFGTEFAQSLFKLTPDDGWQGPIRSAYGWHPIRLLATEDSFIPGYAEVAERVLIDAQQAARAEANESYYGELKSRYSVEYEAAAN